MEVREVRKNSMGIAAFLILLGLVFMAATFEVGGLTWDEIWPAILIAIGLATLVQALLDFGTDRLRGGTEVVFGAFMALLGGFFFLFTLDIVPWSEQKVWWPVYPILFGVAMLVDYLVSGMRHTWVVAGGLFFVVGGGVLLALTISGLLTDWSWWKDLGVESWFRTEWAATWWPVLLIVVGLALLLTGFLLRSTAGRSVMVMAGTIPLLLGIFFLATTLNWITWEDQGRLWPLYPLIVGVAMLAAYFASPEHPRAFLIAAAIPGLVGIVFLSATLFGNNMVGNVWPIFLIVAGVLLLLPWFRGQGRGNLHHR